jgi:hypothetical protein
MRDMLNKSLEMLIWVATTFLIIYSCYLGAVQIQLASTQEIGSIGPIFGGFLTIIFGVSMSFVFAGISFQIMDIRTFTKHAAMEMKRGNR